MNAEQRRIDGWRSLNQFCSFITTIPTKKGMLSMDAHWFGRNPIPKLYWWVCAIALMQIESFTNRIFTSPKQFELKQSFFSLQGSRVLNMFTERFSCALNVHLFLDEWKFPFLAGSSWWRCKQEWLRIHSDSCTPDRPQPNDNSELVSNEEKSETLGEFFPKGDGVHDHDRRAHPHG